ncbi:hypothetical protein [Brevibacillus aydinogluensis]|uniref:Uncharacterized protein n=1 Tax=Brevibacillus aydinogluensis TaxID=927786 RepID=A0AA48RD25_9BACL|nr:hypothetical protein [Brevibacillus aydinogluensis]CAJ1003530.1 hypothetical protein BSPP4475_14515 [Brevibacillus aydinogluensis]
MKKRILCIGMALSLLPAQMADMWTAEANQRGQDAAFAKQVLQDLRDAHWQAKAAASEPERSGITASGADEWNAAEHVLKGEMVAQPLPPDWR